MSIEKLKAELAKVSEKIKILAVELHEAREAMVSAKADRDFTHPLYRKWKALDERDTKLRTSEACLKDDIDCLEG
ncbi:MAG: hypothetical protein ACKO0Z_13380 [Betaproteobacteria bacterium]